MDRFNRLKRGYGQGRLIRRAKRSKPTGRRSGARMYRMRNSGNAIHCFKRTTGLMFHLNQGSATYGFKTGLASLFPNSGNGYGFGLGMQFQLGSIVTYGDASGGSATWNVANISEFSALFDSYRIRKVVLRFFYTENVTYGPTGGSNMPCFHICNDDDDASPPLGPSELTQRAGCRLITLGAGNRSQVQQHTCYPKINAAVASTSGGSTYQMHPSRSNWLSTNDLTVQHYGVKMRWDTAEATDLQLGSLYCYVDYYIECKGFK